MAQEGIIVACDANQEWLLPWWWHHYSAHNAFPVTFIDFGMSSNGLKFCAQRGTCEPLRNFHLFREKPISPQNRLLWEKQISSIFTVRNTYFKKPFALLQTPYPLSLWLDLDCQVKAPLDPLFALLHFATSFSVSRHNHSYSAGVIAFRKDADLLHTWVQEIIHNNHLYIHDEEALSKLIPPSHIELPTIYNWNPLYGPNPSAAILHFQGGFLKEQIRNVAKELSL